MNKLRYRLNPLQLIHLDILRARKNEFHEFQENFQHLHDA